MKDLESALDALGLDRELLKGEALTVFSPIDGREIGCVNTDSPQEVDSKIELAKDTFNDWKTVPAPRRGELIRLFGEVLREHKEALSLLVTIECGKIYQEGLGEVQEMIDICDFAVGLSRQLYGLTIASERPGHRMTETWLPIGPIAVISAFNFPVAVWSWNAALALVCGNPVVWKPSEKTPITALACQKLFELACARFGDTPRGLSQVVIGAAAAGAQIAEDQRIRVVSATGSTEMGRKVAPVVSSRFGRSILELGGNNAVVVCPTADMDLAIRGILFGAVGTCGQRCTSTRRVIAHESVFEKLVSKLKSAYAQVRVGNPLEDDNLVGPLIDRDAFDAMQVALSQNSGARVFGGERVTVESCENAYYVRPALVVVGKAEQTVQTETFAPILYVYSYGDFEEAMRLHNDVPQGLSSAVFTSDVREAEGFVSATGSDCGIANVNIGTSGAEIGGAFGGEKETGGGRESGSDAWKGYMRRVTSTLNYSRELPLAQGVQFDL